MINKHGATDVSSKQQTAAEGTKPGGGGRGSDEVSWRPGAAFPGAGCTFWIRGKGWDAGGGCALGAERLGGGGLGLKRGWRAVQTADRRGPSQGRREEWEMESDASLPPLPARRGANSATAGPTWESDVDTPGSRGGHLRATPQKRGTLG